MKTDISRRTFLKSGAATTVFGLAALQTQTSGAQIIGANDRVRLAFLGTANRGLQNLGAFQVHDDAEIAALCDVDKNIQIGRAHV